MRKLLDPKREWTKIVAQSKRLLNEAEDKEGKKEQGEDSLDDQIDKYLADYEAEAKSSIKEGKDFRSFVRRFLTEAEGDKEDEDKEEDEEEEEDPEKGKDKEEKEDKEEPKKLPLEEIDMGNFTSSVMRLVENYDSLLEVRNTILRRAANFLSKTYESDAVDSFKEELLEQHGMEIGVSKQEREDEEFQAPRAGAAGPAGGGGGA